MCCRTAWSRRLPPPLPGPSSSRLGEPSYRRVLPRTGGRLPGWCSWGPPRWEVGGGGEVTQLASPPSPGPAREGEKREGRVLRRCSESKAPGKCACVHVCVCKGWGGSLTCHSRAPQFSGTPWRARSRSWAGPRAAAASSLHTCPSVPAPAWLSVVLCPDLFVSLCLPVLICLSPGLTLSLSLLVSSCSLSLSPRLWFTTCVFMPPSSLPIIVLPCEPPVCASSPPLSLLQPPNALVPLLRSLLGQGGAQGVL